MKNMLIAVAVALIVGFGLGSQLMPKTKVETVEVEKEVVRKDIVTVVKEVVRPDGTKETTSTTTDKSKEQKSTASTTKVQAAKYHASLSASPSDISLSNIRYTLSLEKRILGDIFAGASVSRDNFETRLGLSVGLEF